MKDGKVEEIKPAEKTASAAAEKTEDTIDNPFVDKEDAPAESVVIKDFDAGAAYLSKGLGIEVKSLTDLSKVVARVQELNTSVTDLNKEKVDLVAFKEFFEQIPDDIFAITEKYYKGEDYHSEIQAIARRNLDFTKSFAEHSLKELVEHYNPGKFSEEDYQDIDDNKAMKAVVDLTKTAYNQDKTKYKGLKEDYVKDMGKNKEKFTQSVTSSIAALSSDVPFLKEHHTQKVAGILKSGPNGILSMFVDDNGMLKPEAGKLVALAVYGEAAIASKGRRSKKEGATEAKEEMVKRTSTKEEKTSAAAGGVPGTSEEDAVKEYKDRVIPTTNNENPFMRASVPEK